MQQKFLLPANPSSYVHRAMLRKRFFRLALLAPWAAALVTHAASSQAAIPSYQSGDIAWILVASILVLMMCFPGLAVFYGGLSREKNAVNICMQVLAASALGGVVFLFLGFPLAFLGTGPYIGQLVLPSEWFFSTAPVGKIYSTVPISLFAIYQLAFAAVTVGILVGATAERIKFSFILLFCPLWVLLVYTPVARWVWSEHGWLNTLGTLDFAGGLVVHTCAGFSGLALAILLGKRHGFGNEPFEPNSPALIALGAAFLTIGWYGFNAGSALSASNKAVQVLITTHIAACAGVAAWLILDISSRGFTTLIGALTGLLGALVAITPASAFVTPEVAVLFGILGAGAAYLGAVILRRLGWYDDAYDVFGIHGTAGVVGTVALGALAAPELASKSNIVSQAFGTLIVAIYAFVATALVYFVVSLVVKPRVSREQEQAGLDGVYHGV